jgi:HAD superfamily hydrolase (TIGR01509 family)
MIKALVFDFDGLILETEGPVYQTWSDLYASFGFQLSLSDWLTTIGTQEADFDPRRELERLVGKQLDWEAIEPPRKARELAIIHAQPALPGVQDYLADAQRLGMRIGLASSSSNRWVTSHLDRLGLLHYFEVLRTCEHVELTKPEPALYLAVLEELGIPATQALALEDSPNGIRAAKRAGMACVAVPNALTCELDLSEADLCLTSLAEISLEQLLHKLAS